MAININSIYVLPPGFIVRLHGQQLWLEQRQGGQIDYPVDYFFLSLAQERGDRCKCRCGFRVKLMRFTTR